jgi:Trp operon repressor
MSKFKIEHGASRINLVLLKTNIEGTISQDIDLLATWSDNDRKYLVNELLRFALAQEEDFQKYKASLTTNATRAVGNTKTAPTPAKSAAEPASKPEPPHNNTTAHV